MIVRPPWWSAAHTRDLLISIVLVITAAVVTLNTLQLQRNARLIRSTTTVTRTDDATVLALIQQYLAPGAAFEQNHARTQRLLCADLRAQRIAAPLDPQTGLSDCAGR